MTLFVAISKSRNGRPMLDLNFLGSCRHHLFRLKDVEGIRKHLEKVKFEPAYVLYSSSTDFPEEYNAPKDYDARAVIREAMSVKEKERPKDLVLISKVDLYRISKLAKDKGFHEDLKALDIKTYEP
jgi:hypothetical protein